MHAAPIQIVTHKPGAAAGASTHALAHDCPGENHEVVPYDFGDDVAAVLLPAHLGEGLWVLGSGVVGFGVWVLGFGLWVLGFGFCCSSRISLSEAW